MELIKRGHKITVLTSNEINHKTCSTKIEKIDGIEVHRFKLFMPKVYREYWLIPGILKDLLHLGADVVHVHGYRCLSSCIAIIIAHFEGIPVVFTPHGIYPPRSISNALLKKVFDLSFGRLSMKFSDKIIALTAHNKRLLLQIGAPEEKICILPNGVSPEDFVTVNRSRQKLREKNSGPVLLYVGRIDWNKRIEKVVEAMPLIVKKFPSAKFIIAGPDYANYTSKLKLLGEKLKVKHAIMVAGSVSRKKLLDLYSMADVFILPSSYEGFGLSMLEAMCSNIPLVVSPNGGPSDILTHRVNAWLLKEISDVEIFQAVNSVISDRKLQETMTQNAFELVNKKYTWKNVVDGLEYIYRQVIENKNIRN